MFLRFKIRSPRFNGRFSILPLTPGILNILKTHFNSFRKSQSLLFNISKRSRFFLWVCWFQNKHKIRKIPLEGVLSYLGKNYKKCLQGAFSTFFYLTAFSLPVSAIHFRQNFSRYQIQYARLQYPFPTMLNIWKPMFQIHVSDIILEIISKQLCFPPHHNDLIKKDKINSILLNQQ